MHHIQNIVNTLTGILSPPPRSSANAGLFWPLILLQTSGLPVLVYPKCGHCGSGARGRRYAAFCVEGFVGGLDGVGGGFAAHVPATTSPFNLVRLGYHQYFRFGLCQLTRTQFTIAHILSNHEHRSTHRPLPTPSLLPEPEAVGLYTDLGEGGEGNIPNHSPNILRILK